MITQFAAIWLNMDSQVDTLGATLLHFLWQGALAAAVAKGLLWKLRDSSAQRRYAAACLSLLAMAVAPLVTFAWLSSSPVPVSESTGVFTPIGVVWEQATAAPAVPRDWMPFLVAAWFAGATLLSFRLLAGWTMALRWRRPGTQPTPLNWQCHVERLRILLSVGRKVRLTFTSRVDSPAVVGWLRPVIVLPISALAGLPPAHLEAILAHELAHIRRGDFAVNVLQCVVETLLFYHPAVWWISNRVRVEREHCCDDAAVATCGDAVGYARALTLLEEMRAARTPATALASTGGSLLERVRRLVGLGGDDLGFSTRPIAALITLSIVTAAIAIPLSARGGRESSTAGTTITVDAAKSDDDVAGIWTAGSAPAGIADRKSLHSFSARFGSWSILLIQPHQTANGAE
jgi:beta-lactamase regulating signal transducer with metallopeptidase domain